MACAVSFVIQLLLLLLLLLCVTLCSVINLWRSGIVIMTKCPMLVRRAVFARYSNYYVEVSLLRG
jgi:hypothetical protein